MEFPRYNPDGSEELSFQNIWRDIQPQEIIGAECFNPEAIIVPSGNKMVLELTAIEFREMFSALYNGAEMTYPDRYLQIMVNFLKGLHCSPELEDESGCLNFLPSASFVSFEPQNPYNEPDLTPDGYIVPPFHLNSDFAYPEIFGFLATDVMVQLDAIPIFGGWDDLLGLNFPTIKLRVKGQGQIELDLIAMQLGGLVVAKVGSPPNILDLIDGIIETGVKIIDVSSEAASIPIESDMIVEDEIPIDSLDFVDVYLVFVPKIAADVEFYGFGGGIRQIGLCGLEIEGELSMEDIRFNALTCTLEKRVGGECVSVEGWEDFEECLPPSGGGGGGAGALKVFTEHAALGANATTNSTTFVQLHAFNYTPSHSKMLVIASNVAVSSSAGGSDTLLSLRFNGLSGQDGTLAGNGGTTQRSMSVSDWFDNLTVGVTHSLQLMWRNTVAATATCNANSYLNFTIIEFDNPEDLYVQDIRIVDWVLQKKIGGVWITVDESLEAILNEIYNVATTALTTANSAVIVNNTQNTRLNNIDIVNVNQTTRIEDLEDFQEDAELSLAQLALTQNAHSQIIGVLNNLSTWAENQALDDSNGGWTMIEGTGWVAGQGWQSNTNGLVLQRTSSDLLENQITHVGATIIMIAPPTGTLQWRVNGGDYGSLRGGGVGGSSIGYLRVRNTVGNVLQVEFLGFGSFYLRSLNWLGHGINNPFI